jgi:hypothetical protein
MSVDPLLRETRCVHSLRLRILKLLSWGVWTVHNTENINFNTSQKKGLLKKPYFTPFHSISTQFSYKHLFQPLGQRVSPILPSVA